jgi:hypothetical protein
VADPWDRKLLATERHTGVTARYCDVTASCVTLVCMALEDEESSGHWAGVRLEKSLAVRWPDASTVQILTANQFLVQIDVIGEHPDQLILAVGQAMPPAVLGTPEQTRGMLEEIGEINVITLARYSLTPSRLRELIALLQRAEQAWDDEAAPKGKGKSA